MNKVLRITLLALFAILIANVDVHAQKSKSKSKKKTTKDKTENYFDESGGFKHRLWYGGNFTLGYNSDGVSSSFQIGATPMVGYKIIGGLSAGPRVGMIYTSYKSLNELGKYSTVGLNDFSVGAFTRYKFLRNFFVHGEFEHESRQSPLFTSLGYIALDASTGKPLKYREGKDNLYGGIGYNSGGLIGYEIALLYNFLEPTDSYRQPFNIRIGFTYNF